MSETRAEYRTVPSIAAMVRVLSQAELAESLAKLDHRMLADTLAAALKAMAEAGGGSNSQEVGE